MCLAQGLTMFDITQALFDIPVDGKGKDSVLVLNISLKVIVLGPWSLLGMKGIFTQSCLSLLNFWLRRLQFGSLSVSY